MLLALTIRSANPEAVEWCIKETNPKLDAHQYLRDLSPIEYPVVKLLFDRGLLKLNSYLFDSRLFHRITNDDEPIKIAELLLDSECTYTECCLAFSLRNRKYKLYKYLD